MHYSHLSEDSSYIMFAKIPVKGSCALTDFASIVCVEFMSSGVAK